MREEEELRPSISKGLSLVVVARTPINEVFIWSNSPLYIIDQGTWV